MNVLDRKPLSIAEASVYLKAESTSDAVKEYFKKFGKLDSKEAVKLAQEVRDLNSPKIKEEDIKKVVDFLPQDAEDVNKIFS